jgi:FkbM family methyltransferase
VSIKKIIKYFIPYGIIEIRNRLQRNKKEKLNPKKLNTFRYNSFEYNLAKLKQRGIYANTIIDIGASNGSWSKRIMDVFPESKYFLIEANNYHKNELEKFKENNKNIEYIIAAASDKIGQIYFDNSDPFGGLAIHEKPENNFTIIPAVTVDHCVLNNELRGPFLLKLDTHGFEVPIFEGSIKMLKETEIIVVEAYNFKIAKDSLLFYEMCEYMKKHGFRCNGIIDVSYRPKDNFLWQMDLVFIKQTKEEFNDKNYL